MGKVKQQMNWNDWIKKILGEPVSNTSQSMCDDCVSVNASMAYNAGLKAQIIRTTDGKCCEWCNSLAGVYDYADLDKNAEVFHRHNHCGCTVTYKCGKTYPDVHSKQILSGDDAAKIEARKTVGQISEEEEKKKIEARKTVGLSDEQKERDKEIQEAFDSSGVKHNKVNINKKKLFRRLSRQAKSRRKKIFDKENPYWKDFFSDGQ